MTTHPLNQHFDTIYALYVNHKELTNITYKLDSYGIKYRPIMGVIGLTNPDHKKYPHLTHGSYGHLCSFIKILQDAITNNYNNILLLEYDVYFCDDFINRFVPMKDYKLYYLGAAQNKFYKEDTWSKITIVDNYYHPYKTLGTFALAINSSIFQEMLNMLLTYEKPTDVILHKIQEKYNKECYVAYPNVICCDVVNSTTSNRKPIDQLESMKSYRWSLTYDIINKYILGNKSNKKLVISVNSYITPYEIIVNNISYKPTVRQGKIEILIGGIKVNIITVIIKNLFINSLHLE